MSNASIGVMRVVKFLGLGSDPLVAGEYTVTHGDQTAQVTLPA
jgi:hypothetical protein